VEGRSAIANPSTEESQRGPTLVAGEGIGILYHPKILASQRLGKEIAGWLGARGHDVWQGSGWDEEAARAHLDQLGLLITLGGDGTILRAARMAARHQVPILGVNLGRLGFLAEVRPEEWQERLGQVLRGEYWLEQRMMLSAGLWRNSSPDDDRTSENEMRPQTYDALNDVVISRGRLARIIHLAAEIDGDHVTTYLCDGLIVSTATGCTAYALSCGGPILPPELRSILLVPIASHLSLDRAIVLAEGATVSIHVSTDHAAILTVDGQTAVDLAHGDKVVVRSSPYSGLFVRTQGRDYFYRTLMRRLGGSRKEEGPGDG
jgi:NAD+ kinase